ncbi:sensor histidine kinase [Actinomycetes bacterium KLBMP 9797]
MRDGYRLVVRGGRWLRSLPLLVVDVAMAAAGAAVTAWTTTLYPTPGSRPWDGYAWAFTVLVCAPLAARRRAPALTLVASCAAMVGFFTAGYAPSFVIVMPQLAAYTLAAARRRPVALAGAALTVATLTYCGTRSGLGTGASAAQAVVITAVVVFFGIGSRRLADLTVQLRHEREERARCAVLDERIRIARELHDVVAHHMSVISVQAGMARYVLPSDPPTAATALDTIGDTSREALDELRRILSLLRATDADEDAAQHDPAPGLGALGDLVERVRRAGVPVVVVVSGRVRALPPGADLCAYRIVQESLTNVLKHARPASATVALEYGAAALTVTVRDDGRGPAPGRASAGHGLVGMRERARVYGGSLTAGPGPEGGFQVTLTLPTP